MADTVEKVARAICAEAYEKLGAPKCYHLNKALYNDVAKAAIAAHIEALMEPTPSVAKAAWKSIRNWVDVDIDDLDVQNLWQAMLKARFDD